MQVLYPFTQILLMKYLFSDALEMVHLLSFRYMAHYSFCSAEWMKEMKGEKN